jgi:hypothetical protein
MLTRLQFASFPCILRRLRIPNRARHFEGLTADATCFLLVGQEMAISEPLVQPREGTSDMGRMVGNWKVGNPIRSCGRKTGLSEVRRDKPACCWE